MTGMGEVTPIGDAEALAEALIRIIERPEDYARPRQSIEDTFSLERTVSGYEALFDSLTAESAASNLPVQSREA